jgi:hypothetical protein
LMSGIVMRDVTAGKTNWRSGAPSRLNLGGFYR